MKGKYKVLKKKRIKINSVPDHIEAGRQFEQDSAVVVELLQRPVQQRLQAVVFTGSLVRHTQLSQNRWLQTLTVRTHTHTQK